MSQTDKRAVHTDALDTLGSIIDENAKRDAIHLAVEPVVIGEDDMFPGQNVCIRGGKVFSSGSKLLGIIDPFLKTPPNKGDKVWLIVYPRTISSLRHVWEHPDFKSQQYKDKEISIVKSEEWLKDFCEETDCPPYEEVLQAALENYSSDSLHFSGRDASGSIPDEFWDHIENITGIRVPARPTYFSCSC